MKLKCFQFSNIFIFLIFILSVNNLSAEDKKNTKPLKPQNPIKILIAGIEVGKDINQVSPVKVEAAFAFSMLMAKFFDIVPPKYADSISKQLRKEGKDNSILSLAKYFKTDYIIYINVNRFKNILRSDITLLSGKDYTNKNSGTGFAFVNFRDSSDEKLLYDPSITLSIQRAFAVAIKDSLLYASLPQPVFPAKTLVISGIEFKNNPDLPSWELFREEVVNSYFLIESIFKEASKNNKYVIFDFETRDSIYATFKFFAPENYKTPNQMELYALREYEVQTFITGVFQRVEQGGELTLILEQFTKEGIVEIKRVKDIIKLDSKVEFESFVSKMTKELLN